MQARLGLNDDLQEIKKIISEVKDPMLSEILAPSVKTLENAQTPDELFAAIPSIVKQEITDEFSFNALAKKFFSSSAITSVAAFFSPEKKETIKELQAGMDAMNKMLPYWTNIYNKVYPLTPQGRQNQLKHLFAQKNKNFPQSAQGEEDCLKAFIKQSSQFKELQKFCEKQYNDYEGETNSTYDAIRDNNNICYCHVEEKKNFSAVLELIKQLNFSYLDQSSFKKLDKLKQSVIDELTGIDASFTYNNRNNDELYRKPPKPF